MAEPIEAHMMTHNVPDFELQVHVAASSPKLNNLMGILDFAKETPLPAAVVTTKVAQG